MWPCWTTWVSQVFSPSLPLAMSALCRGALSSTKSLQETRGETWANPPGKVPEQQGACMPSITVWSQLWSTWWFPVQMQESPLVQGQHTMPRSCVTWSGTAGEDNISDRKGFLSPGYLQQPLDQRHNQCLAGHVREPMQAPSADVYFWPVSLSFPSGFLCRWACCQAPGTLPALQFSTAGHAVPWPGNLCSQHCC